MISCTETILAYNELFKFLEAHHGAEAVDELWRFLGDAYFDDLRAVIAARGLEGIRQYVEDTWLQEGDVLTINAEPDRLVVNVEECSSRRTLLNAEHLVPYPRYCQHCDVMYRRVFGDCGYDFQVEYLGPKSCRITVRPTNRTQTE